MVSTRVLSIVIVASQPMLLRRCLDSVMKAQVAVPYEIRVVIENKEEFGAVSIGDLPLQWCVVPSFSPRSYYSVLKETEGDIVYCLTDTAFIACDTLSRVISFFSYAHEYDFVGGPVLTPEASTLFQTCSGVVLASWWGSFSKRMWYGKGVSHEIQESGYFPLTNMAMKRSVLTRDEGLLPKKIYWTGESYELHLMLPSDKRIYYDADMMVHGERYQNIAIHARQRFIYGRDRVQWTFSQGKKFTGEVILALLLLLYVFILCVYHALWYAVPLFLYSGITIFHSIQLASNFAWKRMYGSLLIAFIVHHVAYFLGILYGIFCLTRDALRGKS